MSRRSFVQGKTRVVSAPLAVEALSTRWSLAAAGDFGSDIDVLNYALTLEYLESAFYEQGNAAQLRDGIDPSADKRLQKLTAANSRANTFEIVAAELMTKKEREGRAAATMEKARWLISLATPLLGKRPISEISAAEISSLSAMGSSSVPTVVICFQRRARYPSSRSVAAAIKKIPSARNAFVTTTAPRHSIRKFCSTITATRNGTKKMRRMVSVLGRFMSGPRLQILGILMPEYHSTR